MTDITLEIESLLNLNKILRNLADEKLDTPNTVKTDFQLFSTMIIAKSYRTHGAIVFLCEQGYGEDSFTLARTLFEIMVNYGYIIQNDSEERLSRYTRHEIVTRRKLLKFIKNEPIFSSRFKEVFPNQDESILYKEIEREYNRLMELYGKGFGELWSGKKIVDMATDIGKKEAYSTIYRLQCSHSHADISGISSSFSVDESGVTIDIGASKNWIREALAVSFDFFSYILERVNVQLNWEIKSELEQIQQLYIKTMR